MERNQILDLGIRFVQQLVELGTRGDVNLLLSPQNVMIGEDRITLNQTWGGYAPGGPQVYTGFSPPEAARGQGGEPAAVYFVGALLYTLEKGTPPADAQTRAPGAPALPGDPSPFAAVLNAALEPDRTARIPNLKTLQQRLQMAKSAATAPPAGVAAAAATPGPAAPSYAPGGAVPTPPPVTQGQPAMPQSQPAIPQNQPAAAGAQPPMGQPQPAVTQSFTQTGQPQPTPAYPASQTPGSYPGQAAPSPAYGGPTGTVAEKGGKKKMSGGIKALIIVAVVLAVLAGAFFGYTAIQSNRMEEAFATGNYADYTKTADMTPWVRSDNQQQYDYATARQLMDGGDYDGAIGIFDTMPGFKDSAALVQQMKYEQAGTLLDSGNLKESLSLYKELGSYMDSSRLAGQIENYTAAEALADPLEKYEAYYALDGFLDSAAKLDAAAGGVYDQAMGYYNDADFYTAEETFALVSEYQDAALYVEACNLWISASEWADLNLEELAQLEELSTSINVEPVVMSNKFFESFLYGYWTSTDGGDFEVDPDAMIYDFTVLSELVVDTVNFRDHSILQTSNQSVLANVEYISFDEIAITVLSTGSSYQFTRT